MSDVAPFESGKSLEVTHSADADVFKPDLADFDFVAYEVRQEQINNVLSLRKQVGDSLGAEVAGMHVKNPDTGVMLNNLHNSILAGSIPARLQASLAVLTRTHVYD